MYNTMLKHIRLYNRINLIPAVIPKRTFLSNDYKCTEAWNANSSSLLNKINLNDFYNQLDQNYSSKGLISAVDVDIFANAIKDPIHLEELRDLLYKLRLSAEAGNMLESTHHATVRNFIQFGNIEQLIEIIKDPLNFGVFLDSYSANILLDELLKTRNIELAANIACCVMLQEDYSNELTRVMCQYACYKFIIGYKTPEPTPPEEKSKKVEEIKIRIKFLRNPYFDDHFDIRDIFVLSGKTLAWMSEQTSDNLNNNLQIIGWTVYKKYDTLLGLCEKLQNTSFKVFREVIDILKRERENLELEKKEVLENCISILSQAEQSPAEVPLEKSIEIAIENAINKTQNNDITMQQKLFKSWATIREEKLAEQIKRLDRARKMQLIQEKQKEMKEEEQKLWFFENEEKIDLEIEDKEKLQDVSPTKKNISKTSDENYIPPEILPKRKK